MPSILVKISRSMEGKLFLRYSTHGFVCKAQQKVRKYCFYAKKKIYILLVTKIDKYKKKTTKPTHAKAECASSCLRISWYLSQLGRTEKLFPLLRLS